VGPGKLVEFVEDELYFVSGKDLWRTDGTEEGTARVVGMQEGGGREAV
jgi:ELWxxDGT repeat protein